MFGFISSEQGRVSVTERGRNIFAPVMPDDKVKSKIEAFFSVPLFKGIISQSKQTSD